MSRRQRFSNSALSRLCSMTASWTLKGHMQNNLFKRATERAGLSGLTQQHEWTHLPTPVFPITEGISLICVQSFKLNRVTGTGKGGGGCMPADDVAPGRGRQHVVGSVPVQEGVQALMCVNSLRMQHTRSTA